jgi:hypothetical protein
MTHEGFRRLYGREIPGTLWVIRDVMTRFTTIWEEPRRRRDHEAFLACFGNSTDAWKYLSTSGMRSKFTCAIQIDQLLSEAVTLGFDGIAMLDLHGKPVAFQFIRGTDEPKKVEN